MALSRSLGVVLVTAALSSAFPALGAQRTPRTAAANMNTPAAPDSVTFRALQWRLVGPFRGGRANAVAGVTSNPFVYYAGYTGGGVWKTENACAS